uniref:Uncharacterized protein n=1 Tax=Davidia involucrata TaxID=16924 RepID=A0A5B6YQT8_DAVIN
MKRMRQSSSETITTAPKIQKLERLQTIEKEHKDALERAVSLNIPHAVTTLEGEPSGNKEEESSGEAERSQGEAEPSQNESEDASKTKSKSRGGRTNWNEVVKKLFERNESAGELLLKRDTAAPR